LELYI